MVHDATSLAVLGLFLALALAVGEGVVAAPLNPERVAAIAKLLPGMPTGLGRPISDRAAWDKLAAEPACQEVIARAEGVLKEPLPELPDELFLDFSRTGNRRNWEGVSGRRRGRLTPLVLAECLQNQGRFLPAFEELVGALCAERTWVMPAHDGSLDNFNGKTVDIDLASSALGWQLATADYLLGDRLSAATRKLIRDNLRRRILDPFLDMVHGKRLPNWWILTTNNWNAVCLAGVTGAALAAADSRSERAEFVAGAEKFSRNFLAGFPTDGYCTEGLGYWDYGFGNYVLLGETIWQATGGQLDLFMLPEVRMPAAFGARIQIIGGVAPAFADCDVRARPDSLTMWYSNRRWALGLPGYDTFDSRWVLGSLTEAMLFVFPNSAAQATPATAAAGTEIRTWFDQAGILIGRPRPGTACRMGVALKGGNNNEHHNHNDLGSYVVVLGDRPVLLDPGAEVYTARTFSDRRYDSNLLNSFGHPVPVVAGKLQEPGAERKAKIIRAELTDTADTLELDLTSAYEVPDLKRLTRTFVYSREGTGSLTVTDRVEFASPQKFATALITLGKWMKQADGSLFIYDLDQAVRVEVDAGGRAYSLQDEEVKEDGAHPTRLGLSLDEPLAAATVTVRITPSDGPGEASTAGLLRNGGFELQGWCWELPRDGLGTISDEQAASGKCSLKITDPGPGVGSNVSSARRPVPGAGQYVLRGKVRHVSGSGIGMYLKLYDAAGELLNPSDAQGNIAPVGSLQGAVGEWKAFSFPFETPPAAAAMQVWIHSYDAVQVEAYLDDLEIAPA